MHQTPQTDRLSVYDHGVLVFFYANKLYNYLKLKDKSFLQGMRIPDWLYHNRDSIAKSLVSFDTMKNYTIFHDCGKTLCLEYDKDGRRHFPNHAKHSYQLWKQFSQTEAELMLGDMRIHTMKATEIEDFLESPYAFTWLVVGLSELHANASMFGGIESTSFKIKYKQIKKRGNAMCKKEFNQETKDE